MKNFFLSIKNWFVLHAPTRRRLIQIYAALLYNANLKGYINGQIYTGNSKYACVPGMNCYSCPGAVAACPLGALQNALASSDKRPAYFMLGILGLFGLMLARTICGFLCPVGLGQDLLHKIRSPKVRKNRITRILSYLKYVLLVVLVIAIPVVYSIQGNGGTPGFCKTICPAGTFGGGLGLLLHPNNRALLDMLGPIFTWKFCVMVAIIVASVFLYRPFCRFLCPLGAIYGFFNRIALIGVKLDEAKCTDCGLCVAHCKMDIKKVGDHECINCGECMSVCPAKAITWKGSKIFLKRNEVSTPASTESVDIRTMRLDHSTNPPAPIITTLNSPALAVATVPPAPNKPAESEKGGKTVLMSSSEATNLGGGENSGVNLNGSGKKHDRNFWLRFAAWTAALVVLFTSLIYFNFIDVSAKRTGIEVGMTIPEFNVRVYGENENGKYVRLEETFNPLNNSGKVTVINFWATWCGPCIAEIPDFNKVAIEFPEIDVVAIHGDSGEVESERKYNNVAKYISEHWGDYKIKFVQDNIEGLTCLTYEMLGGSNVWPVTFILDKNCVISFRRYGSINYETLKAEVQKALEK